MRPESPDPLQREALAQKLLSTVLDTFAAAEKQPAFQMRSSRLVEPGVWLYFRCLSSWALAARYHYVDGPDAPMGRAVVLADISIDESLQRQGLLTRMMRTLEENVPGLVYIELENVVTEGLLAHLKRMGWRERVPGWQVSDGKVGGCWYRRVERRPEIRNDK
ncbi:hypothetical protein [Acidovorax sp.]|uniref:hypothetical protein n=1 Tax=Acidovorax sp. TaxID=1872122 RepID=UPI00391F9937